MDNNLNLGIPDIISDDGISEIKNNRRELSKKLENDKNFKKEYIENEKRTMATKLAETIQALRNAGDSPVEELDMEDIEDIEDTDPPKNNKKIVIKHVDNIHIYIY